MDTIQALDQDQQPKQVDITASRSSWRHRWRWAVRAAAGLSGCTLVLWVLSPWYELMRRTDDSMTDAFLYIVEKGTLPERGDVVAFRMTPELAGPYRDRPFARVGRVWGKRATGMPGDTVILEGNHILVNNTIVATVQTQDSQGLPLRPAALVNPIPTGHYFVTLPHPRSFDSRYIGLIRREDVIGVARPIF